MFDRFPISSDRIGGRDLQHRDRLRGTMEEPIASMRELVMIYRRIWRGVQGTMGYHRDKDKDRPVMTLFLSP